MKMDYIKSPYKEEGEEDGKNGKKPLPSYVESILFYLSIVCAFIFIGKIYCDEVFKKTTMALFIPTIYWMFLRASRKDMNATSHLIAAGMGALGGALAAILTK